MARRRRKQRGWKKRALFVLCAVPALYLFAALVGSLVAVNPGWSEPEQGITIYLADNGVHSDIIMPAKAAGLDWARIVPKSDFAEPDPAAGWVAFGSGEERVYLETPRWRDIKPRTIWSALTGGKRVMHVEWISDPVYAVREVRLRPAEYRRLWAAVRSDFELDSDGRAQHIDHSGYGKSDTFYRATGKASALRTCNSWASNRLRLAGVKTSVWPPFVQGFTWRYRRR